MSKIKYSKRRSTNKRKIKNKNRSRYKLSKRRTRRMKRRTRNMKRKIHSLRGGGIGNKLDMIDDPMNALGGEMKKKQEMQQPMYAQPMMQGKDDITRRMAAIDFYTTDENPDEKTSKHHFLNTLVLKALI